MSKERFYRTTGEGLLFLLEQRTEFKIEGLENIPKNEPVIIVFNHPSVAARYSFLGLAAVIASYPRKITDAVSLTSANFKPMIGRAAIGLAKKMGIEMIAVKNEDRDLPIPTGLIRAKKLLEQGKTIIISPEGKGTKKAALGEAKRGAAWLALKTGASILPVGIEFDNNVGLKEFLRDKRKLFIKIGQVFGFKKVPHPSEEQLLKATENIMNQISQLLPPEMRGQH